MGLIGNRGRGAEAGAALLAALLVVALSGSESAASVTATLMVEASAGGSVGSEPSGAVDCPPTCTTTADTGTALRLVARPAAGYHFVGWSDECSGAAVHCDLVVNAPMHVVASFAGGDPPSLPDVADLHVTVAGDGTVISDPPGTIDCPPDCSVGFSGGSVIPLLARAYAGSTLVGWGGDCSGTGQCQLDMASSHTVTAAFQTQDIHEGSSQLTIFNTAVGPPAAPGIAPGDDVITYVFLDAQQHEQAGTCPDACTPVIPNGHAVTLTASAQSEQNQFDGWSGACEGEAPSCKLVMDRPRTVVGVFGARRGVPRNGLNVTRSGQGSITSWPPGIRCGTGSNCSAAYDRETTVSLVATGSGPYFFDGWKDDCTSSPCMVRMDAPRSVTARFRRWQDRLRVRRSGSGGGTVTSNPAGIACGGKCDDDFPRGFPVTLGHEADTRSKFTGWSGACEGMGACTIQMDGNERVVAEFDVCATKVFERFSTSVRLRARRVRVGFVLAEAASAFAQLRRRGRVVDRESTGRLGAGSHSLELQVPRRPARAKLTVRLSLIDACGSVTRSKAIAIGRRG